ncbi:uncharacterized protein LOC111057123 [Nilaparvata lugens]|uniref:uncharacterized protein LOC111057123 n=1 Tax=Nilaparvata lugens TaxID=108931 RepID=UPI000B99BA2A|nr:uncharacterized protein LOC111057123 [Nilaparvata lugens]
MEKLIFFVLLCSSLVTVNSQEVTVPDTPGTSPGYGSGLWSYLTGSGSSNPPVTPSLPQEVTTSLPQQIPSLPSQVTGLTGFSSFFNQIPLLNTTLLKIIASYTSCTQTNTNCNPNCTLNALKQLIDLICFILKFLGY